MILELARIYRVGFFYIQSGEGKQATFILPMELSVHHAVRRPSLQA